MPNQVLTIGGICNETKETIYPKTRQKVLEGNLTNKAVYQLVERFPHQARHEVRIFNPFDPEKRWYQCL
jgi:hypothetical protein